MWKMGSAERSGVRFCARWSGCRYWLSFMSGIISVKKKKKKLISMHMLTELPRSHSGSFSLVSVKKSFPLRLFCGDENWSRAYILWSHVMIHLFLARAGVCPGIVMHFHNPVQY